MRTVFTRWRSITHRRFVWAIRSARENRDNLRRVPEMLLLIAAALLVAGVIAATAKTADWAEIFRGQAVNFISAAVLATFAYLLFIFRFRNAQLAAYRERFRLPTPDNADKEVSDVIVVVVGELLNARPPLACLVVGPRDDSRWQLIEGVADKVAERKSTPVIVDVSTATGEESLPILIRDTFVNRLVGSSGDPENGKRLYRRLVRRRNIVALLTGLDSIAQGRPLTVRRSVIGRLLQSSVDERLPFVGCIHEALAPSISEVAVFRSQPLSPDRLLKFAQRRLETRRVALDEAMRSALRGALSIADATLDSYFLNIGIDLIARRILRGMDAATAITEVFAERQAFFRHIQWMCEWGLRCSIVEAAALKNPAAIALAAIGIDAHYRQSDEVNVGDIEATLDGDIRRRFLAGVSALTLAGVVDGVDAPGSKRVRFAHSGWFTLAGAVGLQLDTSKWRDLLRDDTPTITHEALTAALWMYWRDGADSLSHVLRRLYADPERGVALECVIAVLKVFQNADASVIDADGLAFLRRAWDLASDVVKLRFVAHVQLRDKTELVRFLWSQVIPPAFASNSFRVRRAICNRLGALGRTTWRELRQDWLSLVRDTTPSDVSPLSYRNCSRARQPWRGSSVASLAWTFPHLLLSLSGTDADEAYDLLAELRRLVLEPLSRARMPTHDADIGLEISLAEGFKAAGIAAAKKCDDRWLGEALALLESSRSWLGKQELLQAVAFGSSGRHFDSVLESARRWESARQAHPFVRETAALVGRHLQPSDEQVTRQTVWRETQEALDDGGVALSQEAQRLLAVSTLLIVMAEHRYRQWVNDDQGSSADGAEARNSAFVKSELPACFRDRHNALTMFDVKCDCEFKFCGGDARTGVLKQQRRFSRSFVQRAWVTAERRPYASSDVTEMFVTKELAHSWRALDRELILMEKSRAQP